jgi:biotin carboxyl carrier protein
MKFTAIVDGQSCDVELTGGAGAFEAELDGRRYALALHAVEPGVYWLNWNNRSIEISVTPAGGRYSVAVNGRTVEVEILDARAALRKAARHGHAGAVELRAPMPGKVVKVLVTEGATVEMNQGLLVIEAMKMQNELKSPKAGVVRRIGVSETSAVNAGDLLVIVE